MKQENKTPLDEVVPSQHDGGQENVHDTVSATGPEEAKRAFIEMSELLFDVNRWKEIAPTGVTFSLYTPDGDPADRQAAQGDYIKVDIPGSGSADGSGADWVRISETGRRQHSGNGGREISWITVQPSGNPQNPDGTTAHFFDRQASNTFVAGRTGKELHAGVFGRNESMNTNVSTLGALIRDFVVTLGARAGLSGIEWKIFVTRLLAIAGKK